MSEASLIDALNAAGALGLDVSEGQITLTGECARHDLEDLSKPSPLKAFSARVAPGDQRLLKALETGEPLDARLRLIARDGRVHYVRLIGQGDREGAADWRGLLLPAGRSPDGGLAAIDMETALRQGLADGEVVAHHQPIVALRSGTLAGFEALARWERADGSLAGPEEFLSLAVEQGLVGEVGEAVRACAARDCAAWHAGLSSDAALFVAANATASELCAPDFAQTLIEAVDAAGLNPRCFKLEISETEVMRDPDAAETAMKALRRAGFSLALDDFGTGYSSLSRLDRFPFDTVKIDQYFTRLAEADPSARTIISGVVRIARSYGMTVVAEGVETPSTAQLCLELGCDYGQGFRFARALAPEDAAAAVTHGIEGRFEGMG